MGNFEQIDTGAVANTASVLDRLNNDISREFASVQRAFQILETKWDGQAAQTVRNTSGLAKYEEYRKIEMTQYAMALRSLISEGYNAVEEENVSLADYFK